MSLLLSRLTYVHHLSIFTVADGSTMGRFVVFGALYYICEASLQNGPYVAEIENA